VADHSDDRGIGVQLGGDPHRHVLASRVVRDSELERAAAQTSLGVDLVDRQLRRLEHRGAPRLSKWSREPEDDRAARPRARGERESDADESGAAHEPSSKCRRGNGMTETLPAAHRISTQFSRPMWTNGVCPGARPG